MTNLSHFLAPEPDENWRHRSRCAGVDPDIFFPPSGNAGNQPYAAAKAFCGECPVSVQCLQSALDAEVDPQSGRPISATYRYGVYGGLSPLERATVAKKTA
jgi:hypothetical protein